MQVYDAAWNPLNKELFPLPIPAQTVENNEGMKINRYAAANPLIRSEHILIPTDPDGIYQSNLARWMLAGQTEPVAGTGDSAKLLSLQGSSPQCHAKKKQLNPHYDPSAERRFLTDDKHRITPTQLMQSI